MIPYQDFIFLTKDKEPINRYYSETTNFEDYLTSYGVVRYSWTKGGDYVEETRLDSLDSGWEYDDIVGKPLY